MQIGCFRSVGMKWKAPLSHSGMRSMLCCLPTKAAGKRHQSGDDYLFGRNNGDRLHCISCQWPFHNGLDQLQATDRCDDSHGARFRLLYRRFTAKFLHLGDAAVMPDNPPPGHVQWVTILLHYQLLGAIWIGLNRFIAHVDYEQKGISENCTG